MARLLLLCVCTFCISGCERRGAPGGDLAAPPRPPLTTAPAVGTARAATPLHLDRRARESLRSASAPALGPYALIRDEIALARVWPRDGGEPPSVDFRTTNILALRVHAGVSADSAAPRVLVRQGLTFVMLRRGVGPTTFTAGSHVQLYAIPIAGGAVRTVAYEPVSALPG